MPPSQRPSRGRDDEDVESIENRRRHEPRPNPIVVDEEGAGYVRQRIRAWRDGVQGPPVTSESPMRVPERTVELLPVAQQFAYVPHGEDVPHYKDKKTGGPARIPRAIRKEREWGRVQQYRSSLRGMSIDDPGLMWTIIGIFVAFIVLVGFIWYIIKHPRNQYGLPSPPTAHAVVMWTLRGH